MHFTCFCHVSFPTLHSVRSWRWQPGPLRGGQGLPCSFRCLPSLQRGGERSCCGNSRGWETPTAGSRGILSWDGEFSIGCMRTTNWDRLVWPGTSHLPMLSSWQQSWNWLYLGPPSQGGCGFCEMNLCQISAESSRLNHAFALCLFSCDATHPVLPWQNRQFNYSPRQSTAHCITKNWLTHHHPHSRTGIAEEQKIQG